VLPPDKIVDRGSPVMANRVAASSPRCSASASSAACWTPARLFRYLVWGTEKSRNRKLDDGRWVFWKKLTRSRLSAEVRTALKLILVRAQRAGEVALASRP